MNPEKFQEQILQNAVQMDASINFKMCGDINIFPCPREDDKQVTDGSRVNYKAGVSVDADGRTKVKRYNVGKNGPMHDTLYETAHGAVKMTRPIYGSSHGKRQRRTDQEYVYVTFKFPKKYGLALTKAAVRQD